LASDARIVSGTLSGTTADSLLVTGNIATSSYTLTTDVVKGMRIDGVISGTGGLTKISNDTLILSGTNTYTGSTTISTGAVEIKNAAAFGTASGTTTVASGSTVQIEGSSFNIPEPITINGNGVLVSGVNQGAIKNIRNQNTWSGLITLGSASTIVSGTLSGTTADSLLVTGNIATSSYTLTTDVVKGMRIHGVISGTGGLTKISNDTLILSGANTYSGLTTLTNGVIEAKNNTAFGTATGTTTVAAGTTIQIEGGGLTIAEPITINGDGVVVGSINQGAIKNIRNINTLTGLITLGSASTIVSGTLSGTTTDSLLILTGGVNTASYILTTDVVKGMRIDGVITGNGGLTKISNDTLLLGGTNTYTGLTTISNGIVSVKNSAAFGTVTGTTTVSSGAGVKLDATALTVNEGFNIIGTGVNNKGVIKNSTGTNIISGTISLTGDARINVDAGTMSLTNATSVALSSYTLNAGVYSGTSLSITNAFTGNGSFIKDSTGTIYLTGSSPSYSGPITVYNGVMNIQNANALGATSAATTVNTGAALQLQGGVGIAYAAEPINIVGTGINNDGAIRNLTGANSYSGTISLTGAARINVDAGTLSLTSTGTSIALDGNALNAGVYSGTSMYVSGALTGSGTLTKDSTGTLYLSGTNSSYTGAITIYKGVMNIQNANALGAPEVATTVLTNAALQIQGGITVPEATINIIGTGINSDGAIRNMTGSNELSGTINLTGNARINSDAGTLSMTNNITSISMSTYNLNIGGLGSGIVSVSGVIGSEASGAGTLTKDGSSTNKLYVSGNNTYIGNTVISNGVLNVQHANGLGKVAGSTSVSSAAALEIQGGITLDAEPITLSSTGISTTTGGIRNISGDNNITGTITSAAASRINSDAGTLTLNNNTNALILNGTTIIGGTSSTTITGKISGSSYVNTLTMDGTGVLSLSSTSNDYSGQTIITSGMVKINNENSLGATSNVTQNNTVVSGTGTVYIDAITKSFAEAFTISGTGTSSIGAIRNPSGVNTLAGLITLTGNASIVSTGTGTTDSLLITGNIATGSSTLTFDVTKGMRVTGVISGTGGFVKNSADTLLLYNTADNTYSCITTINAGVVRINNNTAFGNASSTTASHTIINGGTLLVDKTGFTIAEPFTITGDGITVAGVTQGAIKTLFGVNSLTGQITLGANARIVSGTLSGTTTDSLKLGAIVTSSPYILTLFTNVGTRTTGVISGSGSITKEGADTLKISAVNTYTGTTKLSSGGILAGGENVMPSSATNQFVFNGGTYSSGGFSNTLGILSILENSGINIKFLPIHGITFTGKGSFVSGKNVIIYGWSGLTAPALSKNGALISSNATLAIIYLRPTGNIGVSKSGGLTRYGQVVSASIGADFNGRIYFTNGTTLTQFQLNRLRFYVDPSPTYTSSYNYFSSTQNGSSKELIANDTLKVEPVDPISTTAVTSITSTTASSGGTISSTLVDVVTASGVVWSTSSNPTVDLSTKTSNGAGFTTFTSNITGLVSGTTYYVRAYATYSTGTNYGQVISFTTP